MKRRFAILAVLIGAYLLYGLAYPSATVRYRLTLDVATPEGLKTGSGVIEFSVRRQPTLLGQSATHHSLRGQAVVVDLGERGRLFALLTGRTPEGYPGQPAPFTMVLRNLAPKYFSLGMRDTTIRNLPSLRTKADLSQEHIPYLVRFRFEDHPKTVERVEPDDLAKSFGPGVRLERATVEFVNAGIWPLNRIGLTGVPITAGIEETLPWLKEFFAKRLDGNRFGRVMTTNKTANALSSGAFATKRF